MDYDEEAQRLIARLRNGVVAQGALSVGMRNELLAAMGDAKLDDKEHALVTEGLLRRLRLSELCFARVYPIWEQIVGTRDPLKMIEAGHMYLDRQIDWKQSWKIQNGFSAALQHVYELPKGNFHAAYVGFAARNTVFVVLNDDWHTTPDPDDERDDGGWDPYFMAACAEAHELPWGSEFEPDRFREFWLWMLDTAVPTAWTTPARWW